MEAPIDWQFDFQWLALRHQIRDMLGCKELPDLNAMLFLVGMQELGTVRSAFTKEEKQDLMHIAVCTLLSQEGYYTFKGRDADGWPHFELARLHDTAGVHTQEAWLKRLLIRYFEDAGVVCTTMLVPPSDSLSPS
jgi:hypothetical protein